MRVAEVYTPPNGCRTKSKPGHCFQMVYLPWKTRLVEAASRVEDAPRCHDHGTEAGTAMCAIAGNGKPPPFPYMLKKITKQNSFSSVHMRECLASATEAHSCRVSLSIKWHACPLPRKILVPNTNHAPWLPSSVYSSRTAIHPCSVWKILKWLRWIFSLTVLARAGICSRVDVRSSQRQGSALNSLYRLTPCKWRGVTVRAL